MLISRKLVQRRGIGEKCGFFATRQPSPKGLRESGIPSPPLPSPSEEKCLFYDQHSFLKQGGSAVGGDIVGKEVLAHALLSCLPHLR